MVLVKVLKRKDASSVVVAVTVGILLVSFLQNFTSRWAAWLSGLQTSQYSSAGGDWKTQYLNPAVMLIVELVALEVLGWICVWVAMAFKKK